MSPYVLSATAVILLAIIAVLWRYGEIRGEPARLLFTWLVVGAVAAAVAAAGMWAGDVTLKRSFTSAAHMFSMISTFLLFLFARSFSRQVDYTVLFWSVPLQFGIAVVVLNGQALFEMSGDVLALDMGSAAAAATIAVGWFYAVLALAYAAALYITLRREGREKERRRTRLMLAAIAIMIVAGALNTMLSGETGYIVEVLYLARLAGVLLLVWAFRGPGLRDAER